MPLKQKKRPQSKFKKIKNLDNSTWYQANGIYYLCKKCKKWYLLENFNLQHQMCRKCVKEMMGEIINKI